MNLRNMAAHGFKFDFAPSEAAVLLRLEGSASKALASPLLDVALVPATVEAKRRRCRT